MPLRILFESLGSFFEWTFQILPILGDNLNYLFMSVIAGLGIYWLREMVKHQKAGEK
ncbi:MAG: Uncharacterised protein [Owenweeksia sp. TMED14]|nr:MAG: Uncharacterised protein [Owenweeksia sp. TMED14]